MLAESPFYEAYPGHRTWAVWYHVEIKKVVYDLKIDVLLSIPAMCPGKGKAEVKIEVLKTNVVIRREVEADFDRVCEVVRLAFEGAEHTNHDEQNLVVRLRKSVAFVPGLSLVAETDGGEILGHILFTRAVIRDGGHEHETLTLAPVAVVPEYQGKGIGGLLIEEGHRIARKLGFKSVLLVGHPAYYPRFGYSGAETFSITTDLELPPDVFMACELVEGGLESVHGRVEFAPEFNL